MEFVSNKWKVVVVLTPFAPSPSFGYLVFRGATEKSSDFCIGNDLNNPPFDLGKIWDTRLNVLFISVRTKRIVALLRILGRTEILLFLQEEY